MRTQIDGDIPHAHKYAATNRSGVKICGSTRGLAAIRAPSTELVIYKRTLAPRLRVWLNEIPVRALPNLRLLIKPNELQPALGPLLDQCGISAVDVRGLLVADIANLVRVYSKVTASIRVDVRLERIDDDACWKFHRDSVDARLLTTYRGPTTEWVQPEHGDRAILEQENFTGPLERLGAHDVALFKGSRAGTGSGIVLGTW